MYKLGIHHLTAIETDPVTFVAIAAETGCQEVSVFTRQPGARSNYPLVNSDNRGAMAATLAETGVRIANIESFMLTPVTDPSAFEPALELGARLGARSAGVQVFDDQEARVVDNLSALSELASGLGLAVAIEFMPLAPAWKTLAATVELVAKVSHPGLAIGIDLLHLVRSGGSPEDVSAMAPGLIGYAQLCDGADLRVTSDYAGEAASKRLAPGEGVFPLASFLRALPEGTPIELEVPQPPIRPPLARVQQAVAAARRLIEAAHH